jgi:hypothetical protein
MGQFYSKEAEAGFAYDRDLLIKELELYYDTDSLDEIGERLKTDLVSAPKIKELLTSTKFSKEGLIIHINVIFDGLFSQSMIRKLRQEMKKV